MESAWILLFVLSQHQDDLSSVPYKIFFYCIWTAACFQPLNQSNIFGSFVFIRRPWTNCSRLMLEGKRLYVWNNNSKIRRTGKTLAPDIIAWWDSAHDRPASGSLKDQVIGVEKHLRRFVYECVCLGHDACMHVFVGWPQCYSSYTSCFN